MQIEEAENFYDGGSNTENCNEVKMASPGLRVLFFSDLEFQFVLNLYMQYIYFLYHNKHVQINGVQWEFEQSASGRNAISRPRPPTEEDFLKYTHKCACKYVKIPIFTKMKPGGELVYV